MSIALFSLASSLHNETAPDVLSEPFIAAIGEALGESFDYFGSDFSSFGTHGADILYIRTGGTEGLFRQLSLEGDITLLASDQSNSLAAAMEILSYLHGRGQCGEILHGDPERIAERILSPRPPRSGVSPFVLPLPPIDLGGARLGVIGTPSDWLIASGVDYSQVRRKLNAELVDIPMDELLGELEGFDGELRSFEGSEAIYFALKTIVSRHSLSGLTIRCFDLLDTVHNTGCLALARLNAEGIPAACEGDIPALLTMAWQQKEKGCPGFQCNLSRIEGGTLLFAHCTAPLSMLSHYGYDTHFESGIGTAIRGEMRKGEVRIVKISPDLESLAEIPGRIVACSSEPFLCRTQIRVEAPGSEDYFLCGPLANHHVVTFAE